MSRRISRDELMVSLTQHARQSRAEADEAAAMFGGVDDPLWPFDLNEFRDWRDFVDRVARPLVETEDDHDAEQALMALYRKASPYFICCALVMADNRAEKEPTP